MRGEQSPEECADCIDQLVVGLTKIIEASGYEIPREDLSKPVDYEEVASYIGNLRAAFASRSIGQIYVAAALWEALGRPATAITLHADPSAPFGGEVAGGEIRFKPLEFDRLIGDLSSAPDVVAATNIARRYVDRARRSAALPARKDGVPRVNPTAVATKFDELWSAHVVPAAVDATFTTEESADGMRAALATFATAFGEWLVGAAE